MKKDTPPPTELAQSFKTGIYEHHKGGLYKAHFVGRSSEDYLQEFVVYQSLDTNYVWIRPLEMFLEIVDFEGQKVPRFKYIRE